MARLKRPVKQHLVAARHADGGKVLHFEIAHLVRLVLDIEPAKAHLREIGGEGKIPGAIFDAGIAPFGAKAGNDKHA